MQAQLIGKNKKGLSREQSRGFATLEILIAFMILILCISAVIMVSFGNQSVVVDSQISNEAISKAQSLLEKARADSRFDFNLVNPFLSTALATLLTNPTVVNGGDTCSSVLVGDWKNPKIENIISFSGFSGIPVGTYALTDIDVFKDKLYVTVGKTSDKTDPTFFVFDILDPSNPTLLGKLDNDIDVIAGLNSAVVFGKYAFVASASSYSRGQMQVIDLDSMSVKTFKVPVLDPFGSSEGLGNSIFYDNKTIYLGLTKSNSENEFNIIDVSDPLNPDYKAGYPVGNAINAIVVRDKYAYIASPNSEELQILNINNPNVPTPAGRFGVGSGNGKSIWLIGDKIYFGRTTDGGGGEDFQILNNANSNITLPKLGGANISSSVNGVIVRDYLSFLLTGTKGTGSKLQIFKTDDLSNITSWNPTPLTLSSTGNVIEPSIDCEGNRLYVSSNDASGQGSIYIIKPGP
ncbi:MAG: hypothetical protein UU01_C0004G0034 [Parcubacteria group bacterium GW2011_GWA2_40_37]|nr:MAG: hypothetical protein UU01_C0004G0034 [Parcubacteria group bacterium GW2011_GWA2_40_37]